MEYQIFGFHGQVHSWKKFYIRILELWDHCSVRRTSHLLRLYRETIYKGFVSLDYCNCFFYIEFPIWSWVSQSGFSFMKSFPLRHQILACLLMLPFRSDNKIDNNLIGFQNLFSSLSSSYYFFLSSFLSLFPSWTTIFIFYFYEV